MAEMSLSITYRIIILEKIKYTVQSKDIQFLQLIFKHNTGSFTTLKINTDFIFRLYLYSDECQ